MNQKIKIKSISISFQINNKKNKKMNNHYVGVNHVQHYLQLLNKMKIKNRKNKRITKTILQNYNF